MTRSAARAWPLLALTLGSAAACETTSPAPRPDAGFDADPVDAGGPDAADAADAADAGAVDLADGAAAGPTTLFDLGEDFSSLDNPHGPWRYGYTQGRSLTTKDFAADTAVVTSGPLPFWHPTAEAAGYYPYVAGNPGARTVVDATGSWAARPREVAMEGSLTGQYSVVQFAAPGAGRYEVEATFTGIHVRLSTTDVHVMRGDVALFDAEISGFGGDPSFHEEVGPRPRAHFAATLDLQAGEIVSFAVGFGANQTHFNDTTGLFARIRRSP